MVILPLILRVVILVILIVVLLLKLLLISILASVVITIVVHLLIILAIHVIHTELVGILLLKLSRMEILGLYCNLHWNCIIFWISFRSVLINVFFPLAFVVLELFVVVITVPLPIVVVTFLVFLSVFTLEIMLLSFESLFFTLFVFSYDLLH